MRSFSSRVLKWPDRAQVDRAFRDWAPSIARDPRVLRIGYFGSYARGNWGVGSDLDVVVIMSDTDASIFTRALWIDTSPLPVPADVLVYTEAEWARFVSDNPFHQRIDREAVWL